MISFDDMFNTDKTGWACLLCGCQIHSDLWVNHLEFHQKLEKLENVVEEDRRRLAEERYGLSGF